MNCPTEIEWSNFVEGESPAEREQQLSEHLASCAACEAQVREQTQQRALLVDALSEQRPAVPAPPRIWYRYLPSAAALLVLVLGLMAIRQALQRLPGPNSSMRELAAPGSYVADRGSFVASPVTFRTVDSQAGLPVLRLVGRMAIRAPGDGVWRPAVAGERVPWGGQVRVAADSLVELGYRSSRIRLAGGSRLGLLGDDDAPDLQVDQGEVVLLLAAAEGELSLATPVGIAQVSGVVAVNVPRESFARFQVGQGEAILPGGRHVGARHEALLGQVPQAWLADLSVGQAQRYRALAAVTAMLIGNAPIAAWQGGLTAPRKRSESSVGMLITRDAQGKESLPLTISDYRVSVRIAGNVALTRIEESFYNSTGNTLEGTFYFPLPAGASISRFAMVVDSGELVEGEVVERRKARAIFESILRQRRDPALLEWMEGNTFKTRIFPINPHSHKKIILEYTQLLPAYHGKIRYRYPLVSEMTRRSPIGNFQLQIDLDAGAKLFGVACPTLPDARIERHADGRQARVTWRATNFSPDRDVLLTYGRPAGETSLLVFADDKHPNEAAYFALSLSPRVKQQGAAVRRPGNTVFLVDSSASIESGDLARQLEALRMLIGELGSSDRLAILSVDVTPRDLTGGLAGVGGARMRRALSELATTPALGATDLDAALRRGLALLLKAPGDAPRTMIYLGDGVPSFGRINRAELLSIHCQALRKAGVRLHALASGRSIDRLLLEGLARRTGGAYLALETDAAANDELYGFALALGEQLWSNASIKLEGAEISQVYPQQLGSLLPGQEVFVLGRIKQSRKLIATLSGSVGGKQLTTRYEVTAAPQRPAHLALGRFWARARIDALLAGPPKKKVMSEIIELAKTWTLITPYSSFLVLESVAEYARYDIDRSKRRRYWQGETIKQPQRPQAVVVKTVPVGQFYYDPFSGTVRQAIRTQRSSRIPIALLTLVGPTSRVLKGMDKKARIVIGGLHDVVVAGAEKGASKPTSSRELYYRWEKQVDRLLGEHKRLEQLQKSLSNSPEGQPLRGFLDNTAGGASSSFEASEGDLSNTETLGLRERAASGLYKRALLLMKRGELGAARRDLARALALGRVDFRVAGAPGAFYRMGPSADLWRAFGIEISQVDDLERFSLGANSRDPLAHLLRFHARKAAPKTVSTQNARRLLAGVKLPEKLQLLVRRNGGRSIILAISPGGMSLRSGGIRLMLRRKQALAIFSDWGVAVQGEPEIDSATRAIAGILPLMLDRPLDLARRFQITPDKNAADWWVLVDRQQKSARVRVHLDPKLRLVDRMQVFRKGGLAYRLVRSELRSVGGFRYFARTVATAADGRVLGRTVIESARTDFVPLHLSKQLAAFKGLVRRYPLGKLAQALGDSALAAFHRGLIHLDRQENYKALAAFSMAVRAEPADRVMRFYRAFSAVRMQAGKSERAEMVDVMSGDLSKLLGAPDKLARLARMSFVTGTFYLTAEERLRAYGRTPQRSWRDWRTLAYLAWKAGKPKQAVSYQQKTVGALTEKRLLRLARAELAVYLGLAKQPKVAATVAARLLPGASNDVGQLAAIGWILYRQKALTAAAGAYRSALDLLETRKGMGGERARLYLNLSVTLEGKASYLALLEGYHLLAEKSFAAGYTILQRLVRKLGQESDRVVLSAIRNGVTNASLRSLVTRRLAALTKDKARKSALWAEAYEESGHDGRLLNPLARAMLDAGEQARLTPLLEAQLLAGNRARWIEALLHKSYLADGGPVWRIGRLLTTGIERHPRDARPRRIYAALLAKQGRKTEAIAQYRKAAIFRPEDANSLRAILKLAGKSGDVASCEWAALRMLEGTWLSRAGNVWGEAEKELERLVAHHARKGNAAKSVELRERIRELKVKALVVVMRWDSATDVDLHVTEPGNHQVSYQTRTSFRGGVLDHDDTDGHGPETYTLKVASPGTYKLRVTLFSAHSHKGPTRVTITVYRDKGGENERKQTYVRVLTRSKQTEKVVNVTFKKK